MKNYVRIANKYIDDVLSGKIVACEWTKAACRRQRDDLARKKSDKWKYVFRKKQANRVCEIVENFPHVEGRWAKKGQRLILSEWQVFIITTVFGWIYWDTEKKEYVRRFRTVYIELGRKNGKSTMSAPIGIYLMSGDGEIGQEVYSAATTRDQAKEVWEPAKLMVERDPEFREAFGIQTSAKSIYQELTGSKFIPISAEGNSLDGLNGSSIIDELHAHRTDKVFNVLETAKGARSQPLIWSITTAGHDRSGICYQQRTYVTQILRKIIDDESYFGIIYTLDPGDDWRDEKLWPKANPNYGISLDPNELKNLRHKAERLPSALNNFLTKHMSVWVNAATNLLNIDKWMKLGDPTLKIEDFKDCDCWLGLDFAPRNDFTSRCLLFRRMEDDGFHYYAFFKHFLSEGKIEEAENVSFPGWARDGWIHTNEGHRTDPAEVIADAIDLYNVKRFRIAEFCCDPSRTDGIEIQVQKETDAVVVDIPQLPSFMCPVTEWIDGMIADGRIHHNGDPVMSWMISNVIGRKKGNWGLYPDKEKPENKIDGFHALATAAVRAKIVEPPEEKKYQVLFV